MPAEWERTIELLVEEAREAGVACGDVVRLLIEEWMYREGAE